MRRGVVGDVPGVLVAGAGATVGRRVGVGMLGAERSMSMALPGGAVIDMTRVLPALSTWNMSEASCPTATDPSTRTFGSSAMSNCLPPSTLTEMLCPGLYAQTIPVISCVPAA